MQILYQMDMSGQDAATSIGNFWSSLAKPDAKLEEGREFADGLVLGFAAVSENVDELIRKTSHHWRLERMARVDRNVIRLATYELMECMDVPRGVAINEAIELAKRFGDENSSAFVNGVIDRIASALPERA